MTAAGSLLGELRPWILGDESVRVASKAMDEGYSPTALVAALKLVRPAPALSDPAATESLLQARRLLASSVLAGDGCPACGPDTADPTHVGMCGTCGQQIRKPLKAITR